MKCPKCKAKAKFLYYIKNKNNVRVSLYDCNNCVSSFTKKIKKRIKTTKIVRS